ncbi:hypothetical protein ACQJBY_034914 [Aegilops geniculata]
MDGSTINRLADMAVFLLFLLILVLSVSHIMHGDGSSRAVAAPSLVIVKLRGHGPVDKTSVALQRHDLSFAGFTNGRGRWQAFPGREHLFPASTTLPFGNSYSELIGGLANLPGVPLGREAMVEASRLLSAYHPGADVEPVKRALAAMQVMISEVQRLEPIRKTVLDGWVSGARVAPEHLPYIEHWDTMSYEIIRSNRTGKWDGPFTKMLETQANIRSLEEALAVVGLLRNAAFQQVLKAHAAPVNVE